MPDQDPVREEKVISRDDNVIIYEFTDSEKEIKKVSKKVYLKEKKVVHYPWGYNGGDKYPNVKKFVFEGYSETTLPVGVNKAAHFGYGFNKRLKRVGEFIGNELKAETIKIEKDGEPNWDSTNKTVTLNESNLRTLYDAFDVKFKHIAQDTQNFTQQQIQTIFPDDIDDVEFKYVPNSIAEIIATWGDSVDEFSDKDKGAIKGMFDKLSVTDDFLTSETLLETKQKLDAKYIEDVIEEYKTLMKRTADSDTTEKKWQEFLRNHSWIFSSIFSYPIILFQDEAYVGGKNLSNKNGKLNDFLVKNNLSHNVAFIEIKTHKTDLIKQGKAYRGNDVFGMSDELSGAMSQVLNQKDNFQKSFSLLKLTSDDVFESYNPKCVVLMGQVSVLDKERLKSFELLRNNSKDVEIITFDELFAKIENLQKLMLGKVRPATPKRKKRTSKKK